MTLDPCPPGPSATASSERWVVAKRAGVPTRYCLLCTEYHGKIGARPQLVCKKYSIHYCKYRYFMHFVQSSPAGPAPALRFHLTGVWGWEPGHVGGVQTAGYDLTITGETTEYGVLQC